jgi:RNA polymerase sigma-70 factor (ECF subfamily)
MAGYLDSEQLIRDFNSKRDKAFDALYNHFYEDIYVFCYKLIDNSHEAQDVTIITLNKLFAKSGDFSSLQNIKAFLYIAARNNCLDYLRKMKRMVENRQQLALDLHTEFNMENHLLDVAYLRNVKQSIENLPLRQRQAIEMLYYNEMKYKEVAEVMGITHWTVAELRDRALSSLRKLIRKENVSELVTVFTITLFFLLS